MADNSVTLEKLEADEKKAAAVHAEAKAKLATFRAANRGPKLAELKKDIADYGFTAVELFGEVISYTEKPKTKTKTVKRGPAVVKYKDDHGNTWGGGKGPRPAWVKAIQDAKGDIEQYRVKDAA